ncbi:NAD(P)H-dependent oxidoreductase [Sphingomonas sp. LR60]|uniref:NAD(P)H-dependent oxidoreductase n=1 Tax=Sphingomonas sp. LR60 TaxID=3050233 RepID=UPI002FE2DADC
MSVQEQIVAREARHAVILCHPDPHSFNRAIADRYCEEVHAAGQDVVLRDLYAMHFDPVLQAAERPTLPNPIRFGDVTAERNILWGCDVFVLIYPIWFGSPPAMMKGYVERVFGAGVSPHNVREQTRGDLLGDKRLLSFTTSAMSGPWLAQEGQELGLSAVFDDYIVHAFGMHSREHKRFALITGKTGRNTAATYLCDVAQQAQRTCAQIAFGEEALRRDPQLARRFSR